MTVADQHSSQGTKLSRPNYLPTKYSNQCERNDCSWSTFLPRYQTQPTHLPKLNAPTGVNLTTVADQFHPKKHTYQTKHTMLNLRTIANQHSFQGIKLNQRPHSPPQTMLNLMTVSDQHSSLGTKLGWHTY